MEFYNQVILFVDGLYLHRVLRDNFSKAKIDYLSFCENVCQRINSFRLRTYFYHLLPIVRKDNSGDIKKHSKMQNFLSKLKRLPRFEIKLGRLQLIGNQFRQKMVDVLMSLHIVKVCSGDNVKGVILIAGDADFVPAIKQVKDNKIIAHLFYHKSSVHNELLDEVDELHEINEDLINKSLLKEK